MKQNKQNKTPLSQVTMRHYLLGAKGNVILEASTVSKIYNKDHLKEPLKRVKYNLDSV